MHSHIARVQACHKSQLQVGYLRAFLAVAKHASFSLAASELQLTQGAVSRQIGLLERSIGVVLFDRNTRQVQLTDDGQELLVAAKTAVDILDLAVADLRQIPATKLLTISTWESFATLWLIPRLDSFRKACPDIDVLVQTTDAFVEPGKAGVDFSIRCTDAYSVPGHAIRLFDEILSPVTCPKLAGDLSKFDSAGTLLKHTLIESGAPRQPTKSGWLTWRQWFARLGLENVQPKNWLHLTNSEQGIIAAKMARGIALARLPLVLDAIANGELVELMPGHRVSPPQAYWLIPPVSGTLTDLQARFVAWLSEEVSKTRLAVDEAHVSPVV